MISYRLQNFNTEQPAMSNQLETNHLAFKTVLYVVKESYKLYLIRIATKGSRKNKTKQTKHL